LTARFPESTRRPASQALQPHRRETRNQPVRYPLAFDPARAERLAVEAAGVHLDFPKNRSAAETLRLPVELAGTPGSTGRIADMVDDTKINLTENRAVPQVALRAPARNTSQEQEVCNSE
jgi:glucose-6-phosphate isomerase